MAEVNPLTQIFNAFWSLLEANDVFCNLVPASNRLKTINANGNPLKDGAQAADFPMVMIEPVGGLAISDFSSDGSHINKTFRVNVATGDLQTDQSLLLEWQIFALMSGWESVLGILTWKGDEFVKHCDIQQHEDTRKERELHQSETGWATIWQGDVWIYIKKINVVVATV